MARKHRTQQVLELIPTLLPEGRVLDAGTGQGHVAHGLVAMGYEVEAFDIDPSACQHPDLPVAQGDILGGLPYDDGRFDLVVANEVIEHMENPFRATREFHRVLRPGGLLLLTTPNYGNIEKRLHYLAAGTLPRPLEHEATEPAPGRAHGHIAPLSLNRLHYLLETNGFDVEQVATANPKRKIWLLAPLVGAIWLYVHLFWSRRRREAYHIGEQMRVILGGRSLVVVARTRAPRSPAAPH